MQCFLMTLEQSWTVTANWLCLLMRSGLGDTQPYVVFPQSKDKLLTLFFFNAENVNRLLIEIVHFIKLGEFQILDHRRFINR